MFPDVINEYVKNFNYNIKRLYAKRLCSKSSKLCI